MPFPALLLACLISYGGAIQGAGSYPIFETDKLPPSIYQERRALLKMVLGSRALAVIFTNPERNRNNDTDFRFRPDSDFLYLTGFEEPDAALVLVPGGIEIDGRRADEILLVDVSDQASETWLGYRMGPKNAMRLLGIQLALPNSRFAEVWNTAVKTGRTISPPLCPPDPSGLIAEWKSRLDHTASTKRTGADVAPILANMRVRKSPEELRLMRHAVDASVQGHIHAMRSVRPGMREYEIQAIVEYEFTRHGCEFVAYPSIVGSGPNSTILHYEADRRLMQAGDIVCMDVAGEYHGYAADITRSFPVDGKFSPAQLSIYSLVRRAQAAGIRECRSGRPFEAPDRAARQIICEGLVRLGIAKNTSDANRYFPHATSHYVGLDVHDSDGGSNLQPGYVLTVEPGIYIKAGSPCDRKWWNIGIRIEDDILVTPSAPEVLSAAAPRDPTEIEKMMSRRNLDIKN